MNEKFNFLLSSHVGNVRKNNEDFYGEKRLSEGHLFVVCDGMGGHSGGEIASKKAVECILDYCTRSKGENAVQMIHESIKFANSQVHGFASMNPEYKGMGTTCVVAYVTDNGKFYYGHVGDSRLYLHNKEGLRLITKDHSYVQYLVDIGDIKESEMESHPSKNQILRALGIDEVVKPEVCSEPLYPQPGDTFMLCSDGLNGMVKNEEIQKIMDSKNSGALVESISAKLIQAALDGGGKDNVTVALISIIGETTNQEKNEPTSRSSIFSKRQLMPFAIVGIVLLSSGILLNSIYGNKSGSDYPIEGGKQGDSTGTSNSTGTDSSYVNKINALEAELDSAKEAKTQLTDDATKKELDAADKKINEAQAKLDSAKTQGR